MKRSSMLAAAATAAVTMLVASPAFAQDEFAGLAFGGLFFLCWGVFALIGLALLVLNIWMLIDAASRQEYEFPGSTGNSKTLWLILLVVGLLIGFGWIVALVYYFTIFKKVRRGSVVPAQAQQQPAQAPPAAPAPPAPPAPPAAPEAPPAAPPTPPAPPEGPGVGDDERS